VVTYTTDSGSDASPVVLVAGIVEMNAVSEICVSTVEQAGRMMCVLVVSLQKVRRR